MDGRGQEQRQGDQLEDTFNNLGETQWTFDQGGGNGGGEKRMDFRYNVKLAAVGLDDGCKGRKKEKDQG